MIRTVENAQKNLEQGIGQLRETLDGRIQHLSEDVTRSIHQLEKGLGHKIDGLHRRFDDLRR